MSLFVVSDLHLGDNRLARMFRDDAQGRSLDALCDDIGKIDGSELVLLGDIFDITAAMPPQRGLSAFGKAVGAPLEDGPRPPLPEVMQSIRAANPVTFEALERLLTRAQVTLVPGNHDRHLGEQGGAAALEACGLGKVKIEPKGAIRELGDKVAVLQHGHAWDPSCASPSGGGETMTGVLHHAVVPFLRSQAPRSNVTLDPDRIIALRPEERVVPVLERWLKPGLFERFVDAFLEILVENGYLSRAASWLTTPAIIRSRLKDDDDLWERAGHSALAALEGAKSIPGKPPPPDVLVLGHTHVIDWGVQDGRPGVQRLYVNLGTWSNRASDAAGPIEVTMPVLRVDGGYGKLSAVLADVTGRPMQKFEVQR